MSRYRYEIDEQNVVRVWDSENQSEEGLPIFMQPDWPDSTPWANKEEAESWALAFVTSLEDESYEFLPGSGPSEPLIPKPPIE